MYHPANCKRCSKPTWRGCGNHIEQALAGVPKRERCSCREDPTASVATTGSGKGLFARIMRQ